MTKVQKYRPTKAERAALNRQAQRQKDAPAAPRFRVIADNRGIRTGLDHPDPDVAHSLLKEALGTVDDDFCRGLLDQLSGLISIDGSDSDETDFNFLLSFVKDGRPRDGLHASHLAQMAACNMGSMKLMEKFFRIARQLECAEKDLANKDPWTIAQKASLVKNLSLLLDSLERAANRFARTFCMQLDALDRYRRNEAASMTVQQLNVGPGGRAIVGNITHSAPQTAPNNTTGGPPALTDQQQSALPMIGEPDRVAVPLRRGKKR